MAVARSLRVAYTFHVSHKISIEQSDDSLPDLTNQPPTYTNGMSEAGATNGVGARSGIGATNGMSEAGATGRASTVGRAGTMGEAGTTTGAAANGAPGDRDGVAAALDELSGWGPKDRHWMFQRWHRGALSLVHLNVLAALESEGPLSMSHLADTLDVSVASATGIVDRMERRGLVERRHDTADRRVVLVLLTPAGADIFRDLASHRREHLARLLRELSEDDLAAFIRSLRALKAARVRLAEADLEEGAFEPSDPDGSPDR